MLIIRDKQKKHYFNALSKTRIELKEMKTEIVIRTGTADTFNDAHQRAKELMEESVIALTSKPISVSGSMDSLYDGRFYYVTYMLVVTY